MAHTTAASFVALAEQIHHTEHGFRSFAQWDALVALARYMGADDLPYGVDSCDPTIQLTFADGSVLEISNPQQITNPGAVRGRGQSPGWDQADEDL